MALLAVGCGGPKVVTTGPDGQTVTQDAAGNVTVDDGKGTKIDYNQGKDGSWNAKSSNGAEVKVDSSGAVSGKNEKGESYSMGTSNVSESELGIEFYPGSSEVAGKDMKIDADGKNTFMSNRSTSDAPDKVAEFYKGKVKGATTTGSAEFSTVNGKLENGADFMMMARVENGKTEIQVTTSKKK